MVFLLFSILNYNSTRRLEETTWTSADYLAEDSPTISHRQNQSTWLRTGHAGVCWLSVVLPYTLLLVKVRNDDDADNLVFSRTIMLGHQDWINLQFGQISAF